MRSPRSAASLVAAVLSAGAAAPSAAQWREAPSGVAVTAHAPGTPVPQRAPRPSKYVSRFDYGLRGALAGIGVAVAIPIVTVLAGDGDCMCGIELPFTVPIGAALGMFTGVAVWDVRYGRRTPARRPTPEELEASPGLARYMLAGALAGGGVGAAASLNPCDDCTVTQGLVRNVPVGAAVGAVGGAIVYGVRHRGRR